MPSQTHSWLMRDTRRCWPLMTTYERFEHIVAFMLSLIIAMLIALALVQLFVRVVPLRRESIVQVKAVVLIALLALSRKFVILDASTTGPAHIAALAFATLVLGAVYWLLRERDDRMPPQERTDLEQG
ncbi:MAG: phosphate-starvation-inducible PsiE family protein [Hydrogenophaga sp.]|uniref:phosphate-starvation-inducible PsiE family protein n=1 Tax=Hydrogenophaga sp. TaxID=1904254 RepID=UPI0025C6154B|nr:phosphate-starvation-inducible PsiE family protein [Hydrogenophaga sp.]MBU7576131.1 phosphate-starvation-inducible PsiE family protein [Hydrogenophaga sp.]